MITFANPVHPGKVLKMQFLDDLNLSAGKVATDIIVPHTHIERIVKEESDVTADTATRLARYFGTSDKFWMNLQCSYDLDMAAKNAALAGDLEPDLEPGL